MALIKNLHHSDLIIGRNSEAQARSFYCSVLGFSEIPKPEDLRKNGGLWLTLGTLQIHLSVQDGYDPRATKAHLAFEVELLSKVKDLVISQGLKWSDGSPIPGFVRGDTRDPFGNRLEFLQAT